MNRHTISLLSIISVAAMLLCGCNKQDSKIAQLETRIVALENQNAELKTSCDSLASQATNCAKSIDLIFTLVTNSVVTPFDPNAPLDVNTGLVNPLYHLDERVDSLSVTLSNLISSLNAAHPALIRVPVSATRPTQMPADVAAQIRAEAERRYPTDYDMQIFVIKQQTEAWQKLNQ